MILNALSLGWRDLFRPRILGVVLTGVVLTLVLFALMQAGAFWLARWLLPETITLPLIGQIGFGGYLSWGTLALFPLMGFFLMAPVAATFSGLFAEKVAEVVEKTHYPTALGQPPDFWDGLLESLMVTGVMLLVALLSLILTPFVGPFAPLVFYGANGWLLGREFFQMAARRHLSETDATALRQRLSTQTTLLGAMIAFLLTVPLLNIVVPVLSAAAFTHLYHLSQRSPRYPRG